jgi:hypothetical protein
VAVRRERVSVLVLGVDRQSRRGLFRRGPQPAVRLAEAMIGQVESLDVYLVDYEDQKPD